MHKTSISIILLVLIAQINLFGQKGNPNTREIDRYSYQLDTIKSKTDTINFIVDSIQVKAQIQENKIVATCFFEQSKSLLTVNFYSKEKFLVKVNVKEQSPRLDDLFASTTYYYNSGELFDQNFSCTIRPCMAVSINNSIYELYGYNPNLNTSFLKKFVLLLYDKIKQQS